MENKIVNQDMKIQSLQISKMGNIPEGEFNPSLMFLIKNITDEQVTVSIRPAGQDSFIDTVLYPGWNVELVNAVKGVTANTLQYGW